MPSKRDKLFEAVRRLDCLACPVCAQPLQPRGNDLCCTAGHLLNVNRRGCINVLSHQTEGCYDAALFEARWRVLQAGCYESVAQVIESMLPDGPQRLLDAGCGEGWYLNRLLHGHEDRSGIGVDISRDAILRATDQPCTALWCTADLRRLPLRDGCLTAVLDVLTPAAYAEFRRVLAPGGVLIKVYPGNAYLRELRIARGLPLYEEGQVDAYLRSNATVLQTERVTVTHSVTAQLWRDFIWMTPLNQDLAEDEKQRLADQPDDHVTIDLFVTACTL